MNRLVEKFQQETDNWKDKVQYCVATASFTAGIVMAFISFLMSGTISGEILGFIGECFTLTGAIFGVTLYIRTKVAEAGTYIVDHIVDLIEKHKSSLDDEYIDDTVVAKKP